MLEKIKKYYDFTDTTHDDLINLLIEEDTCLLNAIGASEDILFFLVVEDVNSYIKKGDGKFSTAQPAERLVNYSDSLQSLINRSMIVNTY